MTDPNLFAFGCGVTFLFLGGVYILLRQDFLKLTARTGQSGDAAKDDGPSTPVQLVALPADAETAQTVPPRRAVAAAE